jgi:hypothetical protein
MPEDLVNLRGISLAYYNDVLYYCGGRTGDTVDYRSKCFKSVFGTWVEVSENLFPRVFTTMNVVGGNMVVAGGWMDFYTVQDTVESFDGEKWSLLPWKLSTKRAEMCVVPLSDTEILMIGGYYGDLPLATVEIYDMELGLVATLPDMPTARRGIACAMYGDEVWVTGGLSVTEGLTTVEVLNLDSLQWRTEAPLNQHRHYLTMEVLNGEMTVFAGWMDGTKSLEVYQDGVWVEKPLKYNHVFHATVKVPCDFK